MDGVESRVLVREWPHLADRDRRDGHLERGTELRDKWPRSQNPGTGLGGDK